ncbi:heat shock 70 kDa protein 12A [Pelomyxa schiedti]|nr:heat shock 70 kDa protein 12A [Pelomyxa schiedti]
MAASTPTSATCPQPFGVACAVDIGTSCTGYCYCFAEDRDRIFYNKPWEGSCLQCQKTKSTLAVRSNSTPEALDVRLGKAATVAYFESPDDWLVFERYKLALDPTKGGRNLCQAAGSSVTAKIAKIMAITLWHIKNRFMEELKSQGRALSAHDVLWVVTVPAIWDEPAKQVMLDAAREAGMTNPANTNIRIALEPEAASLSCKKKMAYLGLHPGSRYLVVDAGGGTIDITAHEVLASGVSELAPPCGSMNGSTNIDRNILLQLYAETSCPTGSLEASKDWLTLSQAIEGNKEQFTPTRTMPYSFPLGKEIYKMAPASMAPCVSAVIGSVVSDVRNAMSQVTGLRYIFLVGGFANSEVLYQELQKLEIPGELDLIRPAAPDCAVMEGALQFAFNEEHIQFRIAPCSYGLATAIPFNPAFHNATQRFSQRGRDYIDNVWTTIITRNTRTAYNVPCEITLYPLDEETQSINLNVYCWPTATVPMLVTEPGCRRLGNLYVETPGHGPTADRAVRVGFYLGGTHASVCALYVPTGAVVTAHLQLDLS